MVNLPPTPPLQIKYYSEAFIEWNNDNFQHIQIHANIKDTIVVVCFVHSFFLFFQTCINYLSMVLFLDY